MEESRKCVKIEMDTSELDDVLKKVEKLREVLLEAKTLLDELASKEIDLRIKLSVDTLSAIRTGVGTDMYL